MDPAPRLAWLNGDLSALKAFSKAGVRRKDGMRSSSVFLAAFAGACAPAVSNEARNAAAATESAPPQAAAGGLGYIVRGHPRTGWTPGWAAVKLADRLLLDSPTSAGWYAVALPEPRIDGRRQTFAAERLTFTIEPGACALREVHPNLPDRITLAWDSGEFEGCGGPRMPPREVADTVWELVRIGGDPAPQGRSPAATFIFGANGSVGGTLACNDGGIRSTWTSAGGFVAGSPGFEQTAMGCNDPAAEAFGRRFWNAMQTARAWRRDGERLIVTFADGTQAELSYLL